MSDKNAVLSQEGQRKFHDTTHDLQPKEERNLFFQKSKSTQEEFALLNFTVKREIAIEKLAKNIHDVNNKLRENSNEVILESFTLFNNVRVATFELIEAVNNWQQAFTKAFRPQLKESDYLIKMVGKIEFVSSTCLRRLYNFQFKEGNIFLLPIFNPRKVEPHEVDLHLGKQCIDFAFPSEERLIKCYKILLNCLPPAAFHRIIPIEEWLSKRWRPPIIILSNHSSLTASEEKQIYDNEDNQHHKPFVCRDKDKLSKIHDASSPSLRSNKHDGRVILHSSSRNRAGYVQSNDAHETEEQLFKERLETKKKEILAQPHDRDAEFLAFKVMCQKFSENVLALSRKKDEGYNYTKVLESGEDFPKKRASDGLFSDHKMRNINVITEFKFERDKNIDYKSSKIHVPCGRTGAEKFNKSDDEGYCTVEQKAKVMTISTLKLKEDWMNVTSDLVKHNNESARKDVV